MILHMTIQFQLHPKKETHYLKHFLDESKSAVNWFRNNNMIVNLDIFQLLLLQKSTKKVIQEKLQIESNEI